MTTPANQQVSKNFYMVKTFKWSFLIVAQYTESTVVITTLCCGSSAFIFTYKIKNSSDRSG